MRVSEAMATAELCPDLKRQGRRWVTLGLIPLAFLLCVGFLTPLLAVICALLKCVGLVCVGNVQTVTTIAALFTAAVRALLGPGADAVDAWFFGRRVVVVSPGKDPDRD